MNKRDSVVVVQRPNIVTIAVRIVGTAPLVQHRFGAKARQKMEAIQESGDRARGKRKREPRDFEGDAREATHRSTEGWCGIPAAGLRAAMISACRVAGLVMTRAKLTVWVLADGVDAEDGSPLVRLDQEPSRNFRMAVRNDDGSADVRCRPMWDSGWTATVHLRFDADQIDESSVVNLLDRAGAQVGIGEGRNDSRQSAGLGWGAFEVATGGEQ